MKYREPEIVVPELEKLLGTARSRWWSERHTDTVRKYYGKVPIAALATQVGRSESAVRMKAKHMGLKAGGIT